MGDLYEHSQIIINTTSATYENRLRIVDKSSEAAGNYTCQVINPRGSMDGSLYIQGNYRPPLFPLDNAYLHSSEYHHLHKFLKLHRS